MFSLSWGAYTKMEDFPTRTIVGYNLELGTPETDPEFQPPRHSTELGAERQQGLCSAGKRLVLMMRSCTLPSTEEMQTDLPLVPASSCLEKDESLCISTQAAGSAPCRVSASLVAFRGRAHK